jgi:hypothetical protein
MQSDPWLVSDPRAARQEGAPVHMARALSRQSRWLCGLKRTHCRQHCRQRPAASRSSSLLARNLNSGKGASRPLTQLNVVVEMKLVRVRP